MSIFLNNEELEALTGLPHSAIALYVMAIRPRMDYRSGILGEKPRISRQALREWVYVEADARGGRDQNLSINQIRRLLNRLVKAGLLENHSIQSAMHFKVRCTLAQTDECNAARNADRIAARNAARNADRIGDRIGDRVEALPDQGFEANAARNGDRNGDRNAARNAARKPSANTTLNGNRNGKRAPEMQQGDLFASANGDRMATAYGDRIGDRIGDRVEALPDQGFEANGDRNGDRNGDQGENAYGDRHPGFRVNTTTLLPPSTKCNAAEEEAICHEEEKATGPQPLIWPICFRDIQKPGLLASMSGCVNAQQLLDEVAGAVQAGNVKSPVSYLRKLIEKERMGRFIPEYGIAIEETRNAAIQHQQRMAISHAAAAKAFQEEAGGRRLEEVSPRLAQRVERMKKRSK